MSIYDNGVVIDQRVKTYMEEHPKVSYREALRALLHAEADQEQEAREVFARRVEHQLTLVLGARSSSRAGAQK